MSSARRSAAAGGRTRATTQFDELLPSSEAADARVQSRNPHPCGYAGHPHRECRCSPERVASYQGRLSGPLLDRIDLHLVLPPLTLTQLHTSAPGEPSGEAKKRVVAARAVQAERCRRGETTAPVNAALTSVDLNRVAQPGGSALGLLRTAVDHLGLSARGYDKVRRVARTMADLDGSDAVQPCHVADALQTRLLEQGRARQAAQAAA